MVEANKKKQKDVFVYVQCIAQGSKIRMRIVNSPHHSDLLNC